MASNPLARPPSFFHPTITNSRKFPKSFPVIPSRRLPIKSSIQRGDNSNIINDSQTLPRPLTSSDISNLGNGSRLRVAYQARSSWRLQRVGGVEGVPKLSAGAVRTVRNHVRCC
ncbi:arogenate dehydratase/prephenate dehydratase 2, chloroplastic-like isoform X1 [Iris pallida]|uniref:Arogenate dehydratase/prephenate dehydratase 2, chloroplastic-like isoform X1 n=1 Tax=Iris pallida TaxID=29817 RepID=A0AAX6H3S0_IRIPA|nr:arogenate dehydratase/prephenate dehydratase 2, chloroplastic-like isoform X1 [Iris pallida]KAJ6835596.1 arogenate dehydratase/prephenate dehydratase 2, chloroplastic-like isoform X1 [Iris pallida]